jgi:hypothetical protein
MDYRRMMGAIISTRLRVHSAPNGDNDHDQQIVVLPTPCLAATKPNILFISIDDFNDWGPNAMGGEPFDVWTPNFDRLAQRGVLFTNAHCAAKLQPRARFADERHPPRDIRRLRQLTRLAPK